MNGFKAFNYMRVLEIDEDLKKKLKDRYESKRKEYEDNRKDLESKFNNLIESSASNTIEDVKDYFRDLTDYIKEEMFETSPRVDISTRIDDLLCFKSEIFDKSYFHFISKDIQDFFREDKIYYILDYSISIDFEDEDGYDHDGGHINFEKIEEFLEKEYSISQDERLQKNSKFKLCAIGDPSYDPSLKGLGGVLDNKVVIVLEQLD